MDWPITALSKFELIILSLSVGGYTRILGRPHKHKSNIDWLEKNWLDIGER